jgi:6-phosphogluconolactonase (cycloisomerase 2 family)
MSRLLRLALLAGCAFALPLGAQQTLTTRPGPLQFSVTAPQGASIAQGLTTQLVAKRWLLRGGAQPADVTNQVAWSCIQPCDATVDSNGLVTGAQPTPAGTPAIIVAESGPLHATIAISVTAPVLVSIDVAPKDLNLAISATQSFTATGTFSNNSSHAITANWSSSNSGVASMSGSVATALSAGTTQIIATDPATGIHGQTGLNVALTGIAVSPANPTVPLGIMQQFAASGTFTGLGAPLDITNAVLWDTFDHTVADITPAGLALTHKQGSTAVTATSGSVSGSTMLTVGPPALTGVTVTPAIASILIGDTKQFTATGNYTDGSTQDLTVSATWGTSMPSVASVSATGLAKGVTSGQSTITAQVTPFTGSAQLNVRQSSRFAFAVSSDGTVSGYVLDERAGRLRPNGYLVLPEQGLSANIDPAGKFLYVGAAGDNKIFGYAVHQDGSLTALPGQPYATSAPSPSGLAITPDGKFLYAADRSSGSNIAPGNLDAFMINANGSLTPLPAPSYSTGGNPNDVVIDPTGQFLYVAGFGNSMISEYKIASNGSLSLIAAIQSGGSHPQALAIDSSGKFLIAGNHGSANVGVFAINGATGKLTAISGSPFLAGQGPVSVRIDPTGSYVYVANQTDKTISAFALNSTTGVLTKVAGSPFADASSPSALAIDAAGFYLMATNAGPTTNPGNETEIFSIDPASGALTLLRSFRTRNSPASLVLTPGTPAIFAPAFAEVASTTTTNPAITGGVTSFSVDPVSGAPSEVAGATISPNGVYALTTNVTGGLLYAADDQALGLPPQGTVYAFQLNGFGGLTPDNADASGNNPDAIAVDPSSRFVYSANLGAGNISGYTITPSTGVISSMLPSPFSAGAGPDAITIDPTGRFLYVGNFAGAISDSIKAYAIDAASGSLSSIGSALLTPQPRALAAHPNGKFLFAVNSGQDTITSFSIAADAGALSEVSTSTSFGSTLAGIALSGDGRFLYVSSLGNQQTGVDVDQIYAFAVDENTGVLLAIAGSPFSVAPSQPGSVAQPA